MNEWIIPTLQLTGPRDTGGGTSIKGIDYQEAYACLCLVNLLVSEEGIMAVRYEGAQDIDLRFFDGSEKYVQLKNEPNARYTLKKLRPILQSFSLNLLKADKPTNLSFELVARSNDRDAPVKRLQARKPLAEDVKMVAQILAHSTKNTSAPQQLTKLSENERYNLAKELLRQTTFSFGTGGEMNGVFSFESRAAEKLALLRGLAGPDLQQAINTLKAALQPKRAFRRVDVEEILKHFIGGAAIEIFKGRVEALTDKLLSDPAKPEYVQQYYAGAPLSWDVIAANGDIERDQQDDLIQLLHPPSETLRVVSVVSEAGAGKSTLAWRVAAELHRQHEALVIRIKDNEDPDVWYRMEQFAVQVKRPFYVLVDDLFRDDEVLRAVRELRPSSPITVLATSRSNEYRPRKIKADVVRFPLEKPSSDEKERILHRLGKTRADLTSEQQQRLDSANQFLVLMLEIKTGKKLEDIIRDMLERLKENDEMAYRAYEYLCFCYQYSFSIPGSLLDRLDEQGRFYKLPEQEAAQGLIFYDEAHLTSVRPGHPVIAEMAFRFMGRSPAIVLQEIVSTIDALDYIERRFIAHLLRVLAQEESSALLTSLLQIEASIAEFRQYGRISEITIWRSFYHNLGEDELALRCEEDALKLEPLSSWDGNMLLHLYRKRRQEGKALPVLTDFLHQHPEDTSVRAAYLGLVERKGTPEQVEQVLKETSAWLKQNPDDTSVRTRYLGLVEEKGTPKQVEQVLKETSVWLKQHPDDNYVRTAYLGLVERKGTPKQVEQVLQETSSWLEQHSDDTNVREAYLGLIGRIGGTPEQIEQVLRETSAWLEKHPDDANVWEAYLGFVGQIGTPEQIEQVLRETNAWLEQHPDAKSVWDALISLFIRSGNMEEAARITLKSISYHPIDQNLANQYLRLFHNSADKQIVNNLYEKLIAASPSNLNLRAHYAAWLRDHDYEEEALTQYKYLVEKAPRNVKAHYGYGRLLLQLENFEEAALEFRKALEIHEGNQMAHDGFATALRGLAGIAEQENRTPYVKRLLAEAEREYHRAIVWAKRQKKPQAIFHTHLGWLYINQGRNNEALIEFDTAKAENPDFFGNYWGIGKALTSMGKFHFAIDALRIALDKAPENLQPPASEEIPELLRACEEAIGQTDDSSKDD